MSKLKQQIKREAIMMRLLSDFGERKAQIMDQVSAPANKMEK